MSAQIELLSMEKTEEQSQRFDLSFGDTSMFIIEFFSKNSSLILCLKELDQILELMNVFDCIINTHQRPWLNIL